MPTSPWICLLVCWAVFLPIVVVGQLISQTVMVGANGSFFEPETVSAGLNDVVRFLFVGTIHSVVQSSLEAPCSQIPGGFSSGPAGVTNVSLTPPVWDLQITNVTGPIWYYCANLQPSFHCTAGMVGAINPPSIPVYNTFKDTAKAVNISALNSTTPTKALSGQGAMATAFPIAATISTSTSSSPTSTSVIQTSTNAPATSDKGAVIGGAVGGAAGLVVITMLLAWFWITRRRNGQRRSTEENWYERPRHSQVTNLNNVRTAATLGRRQAADPQDETHLGRASQGNLTDTLSNPSMTQRTDRTVRVTNDTAPGSPTPTSMQPLTPPSRQDGPSPDIHVLAREVAAVMMQNTLDAGAGSSRSGTNPRDNSSVRSEPPVYVVHH